MNVWVYPRPPTGGTPRVLFMRLYRCHPCNRRLTPIRFRKMLRRDRLLMLFGLRVYQCPHCFRVKTRPWIPFLPRK